MEMESLFRNEGEAQGFRLHYLELYNWGTFGSNRPFRLNMEGKTSLLTGANGSGKTTIVDALLTLLVPTTSRFYNQSSGAESRRERDEKSYFLGSWGGEDERGQPAQLRQRGGGDYSVLLAHFKNAGSQQVVTLAQVRWWQQEEVKRAFVFSPYELCIDDHFGKGKFDTKGAWKKALKTQFPKTEIGDSFSGYQERFAAAFGLKERALSLFNQTVGVKVMGNLTDFVREHMLDRPDSEKAFENLYSQYENLLRCHRAIQKDVAQLDLLQPIIEGAQKLKEAEAAVAELATLKELLPLYFKNREYDWLAGEAARLLAAIAGNGDALDAATKMVAQLSGEKEDLGRQIDREGIAGRIAQLENDIQNETKERKRKEDVAREYGKLAGTTGLEMPKNAAAFRANEALIATKSEALKQEKEKLDSDYFEAKNAQHKAEDESRNLDAEITALQYRGNRIPPDKIQVRRMLAQHLNLPETALPFAGELMQVLPAEKSWEAALEKVLRPLALQLLVPEEYHREVAQFVRSNNLRTRLVYQRIRTGDRTNIKSRPDEEEMLIYKLELEGDSPFYAWLEGELINRYDYHCTDDAALFNTLQKALSTSGLVRNGTRHEKDDSRAGDSARNYVLGRNIADTLMAMQEEKGAALDRASASRKKASALEEQRTKKESTLQVLATLAYTSSFEEMDWQPHAQRIAQKEEEKIELTKNEKGYQLLQQKMEAVKKELEKAQLERDALIVKKGALSSEHSSIEAQKAALRELEAISKEEADTAVAFLKAEGILVPAEASNTAIRDKAEEARKKLLKQEDAKRLILNRENIALITGIGAFINPSPHILNAFPDWHEDLLNISVSKDSVPELEALHKNILEQRLTEHQATFREYMSKKMDDAMMTFKESIETARDTIREVIEKLNAPLHGIVFNRNPDTYLQLECRNTLQVRIRDFQLRLKETMPKITPEEGASWETAFLKIQSLVSELQEKEAWRKEVTDARNWLEFSALERLKGAEEQVRSYENTATLSGGEKAQLTYAIFGAAIAHQFGVLQHPARSLRFIAVDEAFSKLDPEKSKFLMEYCDQLQLQLLLITPLDKVSIATPYISAVHFTEIKDRKTSMVYSMPISEYHARREAALQNAQTP